MANRAIIDKCYEHVLTYWNAFKKKTMKDFYNLYLKVDVLLLVCVFETLKEEFIDSFELDPAHYLSTVGSSWDVMLRFTNVNLNMKI